MRRYFEPYTLEEPGRMYTFRWVDLRSVIDDQDPDDETVHSSIYLLYASQESTIKPKNNPLIDIDQVIIGRKNMPEYREKTGDGKMEAFNDHTKRIDYPYVLEYENEAKL